MYVAISTLSAGSFDLDNKTKTVTSLKKGFHWQVGFFKPNGYFHICYKFETMEDANKYIHYLNGGSVSDLPVPIE